LGPRTWEFVQTLRRRQGDGGDERGAEMIEFAIVVILLITLLYGIITYGLILAAQATVTQAAADATRAGLVLGSATESCGSPPVTSVSSAGCTAVAQANTDLGWMDKGNCDEIVNTSGSNQTVQSSTGPITCTATKENCPSNQSIQCLAVTVSYSYSSNPLFPELPGLGLITPSTISSTNVVQLGSVS
jgi:Flp pilus assembly protein TadG